MQNIRFDNPRHKRIHDKLRFIGEGPAANFRDICRMLDPEGPDLESETHLISHLFREIESALRDSLRTEEEKPKDGDKNHKTDVENILMKLDFSLEHPVAESWLRFADTNFDFQFYKLAHRDSLEAPRKRQSNIEQAWDEFMDLLDVIIDKAQGRYFEAIELIDGILEQPPSNKRTKVLKNNIPHNETTLTYLYKQCDNPEWLKFFRKFGFFDHPPAIHYNEDGSYRYPFWPAVIYLQKVAGQRPDEVTEIIRDIPSTENRRIFEGLVLAVLEMSPSIGVMHTDQVVEWIESGSLSYGSDPYFDLALNWAKNGYQEASARILQAMLHPVENENENKYMPHLSSDLRFSDWEFEEFLNKKIDEFREPLQLDLIGLLCSVMNKFLQTGFDPPNDSSFIWQKNLSFDIDENPYSAHRVKNRLLHAILQQIDHFIQQGTHYEEITNCLDEYDWYIFSRIKLLLHVRHDNLEEVKQVLLDPDLFDAYWISREYKTALQQYFPKLAEKEQQYILDRIDAGLSADAVCKRLKGITDEPSEEDISAFKRRWELRKLHPIADYLTGDREKRYQELVDEFGEPEEIEETVRVGHFTGPTSPKAPEELGNLSVREAIDYLKEWEPGDAYNAPSPEGLARVMHEVVKEQPEAYSRQALAFKQLIPTYVRPLISGLREAVHEGGEIYWEPVLELSAFVLEQPDDDGEVMAGDRLVNEPGWQWTRKRIADLIGEGCIQGTHSIPFGLREQVRDLILVLTEDPEPDLEYEQERNTPNPLDLSINTVRGEAMHALFHYIRWLRKHLASDEEDGSVTLEQMPEVREVLERHLDLSHDPTLTIRSVYGQHMGTLVETDPDWLGSHLNEIFPTEDEQESYFHTAWNGFIQFHRPYRLFLEHLRPIYKQAITRLDTGAEASDNPMMPERRLVEHLLGHYWWDRIELEDELFTLLFDHASADLRGHVLESMGRGLENTGEHAAPEVLERSRAYIEHRIHAAQADPENPSLRTELAYYGWCFTCGGFEPSWAMARLLEVLRICHRIEHHHTVVQKLPDYVDEYPETVLECIELMVKHTDRPLDLHVWSRPLKEILAGLLAKGEPIAGRTRELVQHISHRRYHLMEEFKPLIE